MSLAFRRGALRRICSGSGGTPDAVARPPPSQPRHFSPPGLVSRISSGSGAVARPPPSQPRPFSLPGFVSRICSRSGVVARPPPSQRCICSSSPPLDRLSLVRDMERHGIPNIHAEIISTIIKSIKDQQKSKVSKFESKLEKSEGQVSDVKHPVDMVTAETGKLRLKFDVVKSNVKNLHSKLKSTEETIKSDQRAALNIESGLVRKMVEKRKIETNMQISKLSLEVQKCKTSIKASETEILKFCLELLVWIVGLAAIVICIMNKFPTTPTSTHPPPSSATDGNKV